jgi:hypothetical protein
MNSTPPSVAVPARHYGSSPEPPFFLITIDTEGDNVWGTPSQITTHNSAFLKRFQDTCEEFHLRPTYLVNYEMAMCPKFRLFGRDVLARKAAEIGMHLHAWNAPPIEPLTEDDLRYSPFLIEYGDATMRSKIAYQTALLADVFGVAPESHRAGRWALDRRYAELLIDFGYRVDCSVTPGVSWKKKGKAPAGREGTDYRGFPNQAYWMDPSDPSKEGRSTLLEVPMTILPGVDWSWMRPQVLRSAANRIWPEFMWIRPSGRNLRHMLRTVNMVLAERRTYAEFMLHSSELMPGGSFLFPTEERIEKLYSDLRCLFSAVAANFTGATLKEYFEWYRRPV